MENTVDNTVDYSCGRSKLLTESFKNVTLSNPTKIEEEILF